MGGTKSIKVIIKDEFFILVYHFTVFLAPSGIVINITMVKIVIAPVELLIERRIFFVAFCLGATINPLVISCTMSPAVEFSQNGTLLLLLPPLALFLFPPFYLCYLT